MKTEIEVNDDIILITEKIRKFHPELLKFIAEMPIHINYKKNKKIDLLNLKEYYKSLETLLKKYSITHKI